MTMKSLVTLILATVILFSAVGSAFAAVDDYVFYYQGVYRDWKSLNGVDYSSGYARGYAYNYSYFWYTGGNYYSPWSIKAMRVWLKFTDPAGYYTTKDTGVIYGPWVTGTTSNWW